MYPTGSFYELSSLNSSQDWALLPGNWPQNELSSLEPQYTPRNRHCWRRLFAASLARTESRFSIFLEHFICTNLRDSLLRRKSRRGGDKDNKWCPEILYLTGGCPQNEPVCCDHGISSKDCPLSPFKTDHNESITLEENLREHCLLFLHVLTCDIHLFSSVGQLRWLYEDC